MSAGRGEAHIDLPKRPLQSSKKCRPAGVVTNLMTLGGLPHGFSYEFRVMRALCARYDMIAYQN